MNTMNKNWVIGILVVIALVLIGLFFTGKKETLAPTTNTETGKINIETNTVPTSQTSGGTSQTPVSKPVPKTPTAQPAVTKVTVTYTDDGFSPSIVIVKRGQAVQFVNESSKNMWVASDPYPTNSNYPTFNQSKSVGKGGTYTFTFTKTGTWTYHNDLNPNRRGSVIVNYE